MRRRCGSGANSHSFWAMYSLKMSVCRVPLRVPMSTPCRSAATRYMQKTGTAGPLIVIDVVTSPSGMPSKSTSMSAAESIATPQCPTSPRLSGSSESRPMRVGMSKATESRRRRGRGSSGSARWSARRCRSRRTGGWSTADPGSRWRSSPRVNGYSPGHPMPLHPLVGRLGLRARAVDRLDRHTGEGGEVRVAHLAGRLRRRRSGPASGPLLMSAP